MISNIATWHCVTVPSIVIILDLSESHMLWHENEEIHEEN